jgi:hypothetical protein
MSTHSGISAALKIKVRTVALQWSNVWRLSRFIRQNCRESQTPVFIILTPALVHMAPLAVAVRSPDFQPIFLLNGVSKADQDWLIALVGDVPRIELKVSLTGNELSLVEHGTVIEYLFSASPRSFCIQDADCFVTDKEFFGKVALNEAEQCASGPFTKTLEKIKVPDSFLLFLNAPLFRRWRRQYGMIARSTRKAPKKLKNLMAKAGFDAGVYPEQKKGYFDTLQLYWILAQQLGVRFNEIPGAGMKVFHIGGTSYLQRETTELAHWDYWPMNVHYFNLRLLSLPKCARFRERFSLLTRLHGDSNSLLAKSPEYHRGWRHAEVERILAELNANGIYA